MIVNRFSSGLFAVGVVLMLAAVASGQSLEDEVARVGVHAYVDAHGAAGVALLGTMFFAFPAGLALCVVGAARRGAARGARAVLLGVVAAAAAAGVVVVPMLFGRDTGGLYFGAGGVALLVLIAAALWYWGRYRARRPESERVAVDLSGAGYLCFALAAWNTCGFASMPAFALFPERVAALDTHAFAVGQLKSVMALLVLGWLFTALGLRRSAR